jgi:hypothetical protein
MSGELQKRLLVAGACMALGAALFALPAQAQFSYAGLWVGDATVDKVSDANPLVPDLSFDLGIDGRSVDETLVARGDTWRYSDGGVDQGVGWRVLTFDDSAWSSGAAKFGYGMGDETTTNSFGSVPTNRYVTTYFRKTFPLADPLRYSSVILRIKADDGLVAYLNQSLILRANLGSGFNFSTLADSEVTGTNETHFVEISVPANLLLTNNVLAVEIHIANRSDTDLAFDAELIGVVASPTSSTLVPVQSVWNYYLTAAGIGNDWRTNGYDDTGWFSGQAQLGYGDGDENTLIGFGDPDHKNETTYFRRTFVVVNPADYSHLDIYLLRDDGAVVYINGQEVWRSNLPEGGDVAYDTKPVIAIGGAEEYTYVPRRVSGSCLVAGTNTVAVEIHQHETELGQASVGTPTYTPASFPLRLIVHVDSNGVVRLLKDVIQMWKEGTYKPGPDGTNLVVDTPGHFVLITDDTLLSDYQGGAMKDGEGVGRRASAIGYDFDEEYLVMTGTFGPAGSLAVSNTVPTEFRTNPFRHKYHPDHDNLDPTYQNYRQEALEVSRAMALVFSTRYPSDLLLAEGTPPPGWGASVVGGIYTEVLRGLHKNAITVQGSFELHRVSVTGQLNDGR